MSRLLHTRSMERRSDHGNSPGNCLTTAASCKISPNLPRLDFVSLLRQLEAAGYRFARYGERPSDRHVLWRHDVDVSMHRAARLAEIEAERGAVATYFVNPRSAFYNLRSPKSRRLLRRIRSLGHEIGLHFDAGAYSTVTSDQP